MNNKQFIEDRFYIFSSKTQFWTECNGPFNSVPEAISFATQFLLDNVYTIIVYHKNNQLNIFMDDKDIRNYTKNNSLVKVEKKEMTIKNKSIFSKVKELMFQ